MLSVIDGTQAAFNDTLPLNLDLIETSAVDNALNPATSVGLLM